MTASPGLPPKPVRDSLAAQAAQLVAALRSGERPATPKPGRPSNGGTRVRVLAVTLAAALLLAAVYLAVTGDWFRGPAQVPSELIGVWRTTAPSHADRPFQITDSTLILHRGGTDSTVNPVTSVRTRRQAESAQYTIEYLSEGEAYLFSFTLTPGPEPVIRFRNQPGMEWRKQP